MDRNVQWCETNGLLYLLNLQAETWYGYITSSNTMKYVLNTILAGNGYFQTV